MRKTRLAKLVGFARDPGAASAMVSDHPELAERLGLMTVPATVVLDERGVLRHLNQGFADERRLVGQLNAAQ